MPGKIIILNGTSSAGKTSIAEGFKNILPDFYHISLDSFWGGTPASFHGLSDDLDLRTVGSHVKMSEDKKNVLDIAFTPKGHVFWKSIHAAISAFCSEHINVIYDTVIIDELTLQCVAEELADHEVYFIGVHCSEEEREKRDKIRGNRGSSAYKLKADFIYNVCEYDFVVDTTDQTPLQTAHEIAEKINVVRPRVFRQILKVNLTNGVI